MAEYYEEERGSYDGDQGYDVGDVAPHAEKPKILLMGLKKSGKSSIQKVVFHKMSPNETLFLESTSKPSKNDISNSSFVQFQVWDFPGQLDFFDGSFDMEMIFGGCGAIVYVIDALVHEREQTEALQKLQQTIQKAVQMNKKINFEVFIHKIDGVSTDQKQNLWNDIRRHVQEDIQDSSSERDVHIDYHLTSIYDHSIFEAFSKVIQKLVPQHATLEKLLNTLVSTCKLERALLVDVVSKICVAADSSQFEMQTYELCSDMIDVVIDISCIYGSAEASESIAYDAGSQSIIRLSNKKILYLREVNKYLALVAFIREADFDKHGLIDYNIGCFKRAIAEVFVKRPKPE